MCYIYIYIYICLSLYIYIYIYIYIQGCSQKGPPNSMGPEFNRRGGGTFATEWDPEGGHVRTWFWPADGYLPMDIAMHAPDPDSWGRPYSYFGIDKTCPAEHFKNMRMVFDLTFCGDLGGPTFAASCPEHAAKMTCQEFVAMHPEAFREACTIIDIVSYSIV